MISLTDVVVAFNRGTPREFVALKGLSLTIAEGEYLTVIGSNGAGKSTLLNALSGETTIETGRIRINDQDVTGWPTPQRARLVARVFQDPLAGTCDTLSIEENMALALDRGARRGLGRALTGAIRERLRAALAELGMGLENRLHEKVGLLSGGQRQVVSLVMAALVPMRILLLDEHTAALDPRTARFVMELTDRIVGQGKLTVLMVTHSMRQALDHGNRTIMLHQGRIVLDVKGDERTGLTVPDLLARFEATGQGEVSDDAMLLG